MHVRDIMYMYDESCIMSYERRKLMTTTKTASEVAVDIIFLISNNTTFYLTDGIVDFAEDVDDAYEFLLFLEALQEEIDPQREKTDEN